MLRARSISPVWQRCARRGLWLAISSLPWTESRRAYWSSLVEILEAHSSNVVARRKWALQGCSGPWCRIESHRLRIDSFDCAIEKHILISLRVKDSPNEQPALSPSHSLPHIQRLLPPSALPPLQMQKWIIQPLNREETLQTLDPFKPLPHILIRFQTNISHLRQRDVHEHANICDRRPTENQPVIRLQLFIEDFERLISAKSAFFEKYVEFLL